MPRPRKWKTYAAYSVGCFLVWALIWIVVAIVGTNHAHALLLVFAGWTIGWTSATMARAIYPPPRSR